MNKPTATNEQIHKALIPALMAIDQLRDTISRISHIDRGDSGLMRCDSLLKDARRHLAFDIEHDNKRVDKG